ncbi:MAG: hypothetical protein FD129_1436, partial [bacterium]
MVAPPARFQPPGFENLASDSCPRARPSWILVLELGPLEAHIR